MAVCLLSRVPRPDDEHDFCAILFDEMLARELMKTHVVKTTATATLSEAVDLMDIYQVDSLPVVDEQSRLCGMIAEEDVASLVANHFAITSTRTAGVTITASEATAIAELAVAHVMQTGVLSTCEDEDISSLWRSIFANNYTRIPVLTSDGLVIGTLNRIDLVQSLFEKRIEGPAE